MHGTTKKHDMTADITSDMISAMTSDMTADMTSSKKSNIYWWNINIVGVFCLSNHLSWLWSDNSSSLWQFFFDDNSIPNHLSYNLDN